MNVWIIDDNEDLLTLLKLALADLNWDLYTFSSGSQVLKSLAHSEVAPDVVAIDWTLPDWPAIPLMEHIVREYPSARLIVMSGDSRAQERVPKNVYWLSKPFHLQVFQQLIQDVAAKI